MPATQSGIAAPVCRACSREWVSLARVSVWVSIWEPIDVRASAAAAEGARPMMVPPPSVHALARARIAVVLPDPAGAIASWSRAPEVAISRTSVACPALRVIPLAVDSSSARSTEDAVDGVPVVAAGGVDQALLGGQDLARGEQVGRRPTV